MVQAGQVNASGILVRDPTYAGPADVQRTCIRSLTVIYTESSDFQLAAHFLMSSSDELTGWMILGIGLKLAQSVGAHRRLPAVVTKGPTVEEELAKRAIW